MCQFHSRSEAKNGVAVGPDKLLDCDLILIHVARRVDAVTPGGGDGEGLRSQGSSGIGSNRRRRNRTAETATKTRE